MKEHPYPNEYPIIIGESGAIKAVREKIQKVSDKKVTVLILGESGTGKELVARAIHLGSKRSLEAFIQVNCAAIPNELLESELLGFTKGAFTGATHNRQGKFEMANKGTILLDEIGALSLPLQSKILQVLEDNTVSRLGSVEETPIDVRILAATNSNLEEEIAHGTFRSDLYYRLNVISITLPPLRERKEDIDPLINYFMDKYCRELQKDSVHITDDQKEHINQYHWPGNVRELENMIKGVVALQKADLIHDLKYEEPLSKNDQPASPQVRYHFQGWDDRKIEQLMKESGVSSLKIIRSQYVAEVEKRAIKQALEMTHWNRKKAAALLKVSYKTLLNRIEEFKLVKQ
ncbi:MAG: sigma-54 interaction domain-containing protein [Thermodesulfobacteriota bacterium]